MIKVRACWSLVIFAVFLLVPGHALALEARVINEAGWSELKSSGTAIKAAMVKLQVLLDRAHFSPGEIDGKAGENVSKAIRAYAGDQESASGISEPLWQQLNENFRGPVIVEYRITEEDLRGPFADKLPSRIEEMKGLSAVPYRNAKEKLAERFHMSAELLAALNPGQSFQSAGVSIQVANVLGNDLREKAVRIEIDKSKQTLRAIGKSGQPIAFYPVTVGSAEKPAPDGELKVTAISRNPTYRYNPAYQFKGVKSQAPFTIGPGPNNPVGLVWIGLNKEGYGIHGTPDPSKVSKSESHGCIRMTNWDALALAALVKKGTSVLFSGDDRDARASGRHKKLKQRATRR